MKNRILFICLLLVSSGWSQDLEEMEDVSNKDISQEDSVWTLPYLFTKCKNESNLNSKRFTMPLSYDYKSITTFESVVSACFSIGIYSAVAFHHYKGGLTIDYVWVEVYDGIEAALIPLCILDEMVNFEDLEYEYDNLFEYNKNHTE